MPKKIIALLLIVGFITVNVIFLTAPSYAVEYKKCCECSAVAGEATTETAFPEIIDQAACTKQQTELNDDSLATFTCYLLQSEKCGEIKPQMTKLEEEFKFKDVVLGVTIPSLRFSPPPTQADVEGNIYIPWLGEYIKAVYNFSVAVISILAVVVIIVAGAQIIVSAGGPAKQQGYKRITQAIIGLFIAWGSYAVLNTINPNLTTFKSLKISFIPRKDITGIENVGPSISKEEIKSILNRVSEESGVDYCILETIVAKESGWKSNRVGHDEDVPRTQVGSRVKFVKSGVKYGGTAFTPSPKLYTDKSLRNDDGYNPNEPPNYGLDPRFTHGGGLGQFTVLIDKSTGEMTRCPDGNIGRTIGGTCYNFPELMDPNTAVELSAKLIKQIGTSNVEKLFYRYAGKGCSARVSQCRKMKAYAECKEDPALAQNEISGDCTLWLKESFANCANPSYRNPTSQKTPDDEAAEKEFEQMVDEETGQSIQHY